MSESGSRSDGQRTYPLQQLPDMPPGRADYLNSPASIAQLLDALGTMHLMVLHQSTALAALLAGDEAKARAAIKDAATLSRSVSDVYLSISLPGHEKTDG